MQTERLSAPVAAVDEASLIAFCQHALQTKSYTGNEGAVAELFRAQMAALGFDRAWIDEAGNVIGEIKGGLPGPRLLFDGHLDTVEVSDLEKWTTDPFGGEIRNGCLYGRGASDMKCALAAMIHGLAPLARHKDQLSGTIFVSGTVCEETFEGLGLGKVVDALQPDAVVIGEASALSLKRGQRGRAEVAVTTYGKAAHSSNPSVGINAVYAMSRLIAALQALPAPHDDFLGAGILELTDIISAPYPGASVVPHRCRATFDRRLLPGETAADVLAPIQRLLGEMASTDPHFQAEAAIVSAEQPCYTGITLSGERLFPAWVLPEHAPLVVQALVALRKAGLNPPLSHYSFCTNGSCSAGLAGIPTIGFGPGREDGAHVVDEHIEIAQVIAAAIGYQAIACGVSGINSKEVAS